MKRSLLLLLFILSAASFSSRQTAKASPISPQNPYRSFNITGINYGSMRWEQTHNRKSSTNKRAKGPSFRRW